MVLKAKNILNVPIGPPHPHSIRSAPTSGPHWPRPPNQRRRVQGLSGYPSRREHCPRKGSHPKLSARKTFDYQSFHGKDACSLLPCLATWMPCPAIARPLIPAPTSALSILHRGRSTASWANRCHGSRLAGSACLRSSEACPTPTNQTGI